MSRIANGLPPLRRYPPNSGLATAPRSLIRRSTPSTRLRTHGSSIVRSSPNSSRIRTAAASQARSSASRSKPTAATRVRSSVLPMAAPNVSSASVSQRTRRCTRESSRDPAGTAPLSRRASKSRNHSRSGAMNSLMKRSSSNASGFTSARPHHPSTRSGRSPRVMPSCSATTWAMAARRPLRHVLAAKNEPRCAASCTLSEKAMTLRSSLWRETNNCASAVLSRLDAREPRMMSASRAPQYGQSRLSCGRPCLPVPLETTASGRNTRVRRS